MLSSIEYYSNTTILNYYENDVPKSVSTNMVIPQLNIKDKYFLKFKDDQFSELILEENIKTCYIERANDWLTLYRNVMKIVNQLNPLQTTYPVGGIYIHGIKQHYLLSATESLELTTNRKCKILIWSNGFYINYYVAKIYLLLTCQSSEVDTTIENLANFYDQADKTKFLSEHVDPDVNIFKNVKH